MRLFAAGHARMALNNARSVTLQARVVSRPLTPRFDVLRHSGCLEPPGAGISSLRIHGFGSPQCGPNGATAGSARFRSGCGRVRAAGQGDGLVTVSSTAVRPPRSRRSGRPCRWRGVKSAQQPASLSTFRLLNAAAGYCALRIGAAALRLLLVALEHDS